MTSHLRHQISSLLILGLMQTGAAQQTWFYPDASKLTVYYSGSRADGVKARTLVEKLVPDVKVLIDRRSKQITFQAPPKQIDQIKWILDKAGYPAKFLID